MLSFRKWIWATGLVTSPADEFTPATDCLIPTLPGVLTCYLFPSRPTLLWVTGTLCFARVLEDPCWRSRGKGRDFGLLILLLRLGVWDREKLVLLSELGLSCMGGMSSEQVWPALRACAVHRDEQWLNGSAGTSPCSQMCNFLPVEMLGACLVELEAED